MLQIKGKVNTAICFARVIEDEAVEQIRRMCDTEMTRGSQIRIMPDVHAGKGCTIGTTMTITDKAVPNVVGVDIGCGMYTVKLGKVDIDFEKVDEACHIIPSGFDTWDRVMWPFDLTELRCYRELERAKRLNKSLGTLGGGNHFIEIDAAEDGTKYLVIHSGSRNLGKQVAEFYQQLAIDLNHGKEEYFTKRDQIIEEYKAEGRKKEIQAALKALKWEKKDADVPDDLCYLYGTYLDDYLHDVVICQNFARENREHMAEVILEHTGLEAIEAFHTIHNYINTDEMILRKGAISAHEGELVLIPINMRDGSVLATGKGNPEWNYSAPHGAGRIMSRTRARDVIEMEDYRKAMEGIYTTSVSTATLDEAPMAYKSLEDMSGFFTEEREMSAGLTGKVPVVDLKKTGENIRKMRKEAGISVRELQVIFGFTNPQSIYSWQNGNSLPTIDNLIILAAVLGTTIDGIIAVDDDESEEISSFDPQIKMYYTVS